MIKAAVFDDDPAIVRRITVALGFRGISVLSIVVRPLDKIESIGDRIRGFDPNLLFADYGLYDWTGAELIRYLEFPRERIVSTSRRHADSMRPICFDEFLQKDDLVAHCSAGRGPAQLRLAEIVASMIERTTIVSA